MSKLKSNFKPWDEGCTVILTRDERMQLEMDESRYVGPNEAADRELRAVRVADKAIVRIILQ